VVLKYVEDKLILVVLCVELEFRCRLDILCRSDGFCCTCHAEKCRDWQYDGAGFALYLTSKLIEPTHLFTVACFFFFGRILQTLFFMFFWPCVIVQTCFNYQLSAQFLYSVIIYVLHYNSLLVACVGNIGAIVIWYNVWLPESQVVKRYSS
jgi:hypothetical protein